MENTLRTIIIDDEQHCFDVLRRVIENHKQQVEVIGVGEKSSHCRYIKAKVFTDHTADQASLTIKDSIDKKTIVFSDKSTSYNDNLGTHATTNVYKRLQCYKLTNAYCQHSLLINSNICSWDNYLLVGGHTI